MEYVTMTNEFAVMTNLKTADSVIAAMTRSTWSSGTAASIFIFGTEVFSFPMFMFIFKPSSVYNVSNKTQDYHEEKIST